VNPRFFGTIWSIVLLAVFGMLAFDIHAVASGSQDSVGTIFPLWNITRGGPRADEGWAVAVDGEGNVYFSGYDRIARVTADVFLRKFSPNGTELWHVSWGGAFDDEAFIVTVQNGFVYVGGRTFKSFLLTSADMFVLKFHASNGSLVWSRTWDGGVGYDEVDGLVVDGDSVYVAGWVTGASTDLDIAVLKYDVNGTLVYSHSWGTSDVDEANGQIGVDEKYIYVVGRYKAAPPGFGGDAVLVAFKKTDGSCAWHTTWGGSGLDDAFGMAMDEKSIFSVGITNSFGGDAIFLLKYDKNGSLIWNETWGGKSSELARSVGVSVDGRYIYIAGNTMSYGQGDFDVVLLGYDQDGNLFLSKTWGGRALDQSHGMAVTDRSVYIAGETRSFGVGAEDAFLLKVEVVGETPAHFRTSNLIVRPSAVDVGAAVTISVDVANVGGKPGAYNVTLKINSRVEDGRTVSLNPGESLTVSFSVSTSQQGAFSVSVNGLNGSYTVRKKGCIIATATYGSELAPEVQFLRAFRDNIVLNTFAGANFMAVFDAWYYSFSPSFAVVIEGSEAMRGFVRFVLYPLIGVLHVSATTNSFLSFNAELAVLTSGLVASSLIGVVYFAPLAIVACLIKRVAISVKWLHLQTLVWALNLACIVAAETARFSSLMMFSTAVFVLTTASLTTIALARLVFESKTRLLAKKTSLAMCEMRSDHIS